MTITPDKIAYTAVATSTGGRDGTAVSQNPELELDLRSPKETGGPGGGANPEQLFAMGYGACFNGALGLAGKEAGVNVQDSRVKVAVGLGPEGDSFAITADIEVHIPGVDLDQAQKLVDRTHELCPYSKATQGNVPVTVKAVEQL